MPGVRRSNHRAEVTPDARALLWLHTPETGACEGMSIQGLPKSLRFISTPKHHYPEFCEPGE